MDIRVKVKSRARASLVVFNKAENLYFVSVTSVPHEGEANIEVIKLLAKYFGIAKTMISIKSGGGSSTKTVTLNK
jgi:uncharacterized protein